MQQKVEEAKGLKITRRERTKKGKSKLKLIGNTPKTSRDRLKKIVFKRYDLHETCLLIEFIIFFVLKS